jgi:hypothetical protein
MYTNREYTWEQLTLPHPSKTPFGVRKIPDPMIVPTIMATPFVRVILGFNFTASSIGTGAFPLPVLVPDSVLFLPTTAMFNVCREMTENARLAGDYKCGHAHLQF